MYGNMNPGLVICRCLDSVDGSPVRGVQVIVTWIEADASFGGRLPLYDLEGHATSAAAADSDGAGVAFVQFYWDPTNIGWLTSSSPRIRFSVVGPAARHDHWFDSEQSNKSYQTKRIDEKRIYECVNLGQGWSGGKGAFQFKSLEPKGIEVLADIKKILEFRAKIAEEKIPKLAMFRVMRPSVEQYSLLGGFDVALDPAG